MSLFKIAGLRLLLMVIFVECVFTSDNSKAPKRRGLDLFRIGRRTGNRLHPFNIQTDNPKTPKRRGLDLLRVGRRSGNGLFPWNIQTEEKRLKTLVTFPRIGRSPQSNTDDNFSTEKRSENNNGMWFGPRLGRTLRRRTRYDVPTVLNFEEYPPYPKKYKFNDNAVEDEVILASYD